MTENERNHKGKLGGRTLNVAKWTDKFKYGMIYLIFLNKENIATLANHVFSFLCYRSKLSVLAGLAWP